MSASARSSRSRWSDVARFSVSGLDTVTAAFDHLADVSDEDKLRVLRAGGEILKAAFQEALKTLFQQHTGKLAASPEVEEKTGGDGGYVLIAPKGKHGRSSAGKRRPKHKGTYTGDNAEIAFILEYGSSRIPARHWMERTVEEQGDAVAEAMEAEWSKVLDEYGF